MLASPLRLPNGESLTNRIAKPAMSESLADDDNQPTTALERLYARWSRGGAGLLITGNVLVDRRYLERARNVVVDEGADEARLAAWGRAARSGPAKVVVQLNHAGRQTNRFIAPTPVAPSETDSVRGLRAFGRPRALAGAEIEHIVARFASAAATLERAGFSGVQIHGAHGYLVSQFLSPRTNLRTDGWGGSLDNRARFLLEIVRAVRASVSSRFIVAVKLNSADFQRGGFTEDESMQVVSMLERESIDLLEISGGNYESPALLGVGDVRESTRAREAYFLEYAERVRRRTSLPLMLTGGIRSREVMDRALESGAIDVIGMARPLAMDPDLPRKLLAGEIDRAPAVGPRAIPSLALGAAAEAAWFAAQMGRIGDGREPDPRLGTYAALARYILGDAWLGIARRTLRGRALLTRGERPALPART